MKSVSRTLLYERLAPVLRSLDGRILDLASSQTPSYRAFFAPDRTRVTSADRGPAEGRAEADFDRPLPFEDAAFDHALCLNALYIARDPAFTLRELQRVVKPGGSIVIATPFVFPEAREPHDYVRWTSEGLEQLFADAGLGRIETVPFGGHFTSALYIVEPFLRLAALQYAARRVAITLDRFVPERYRRARPCPLGYLVVARTT